MAPLYAAAHVLRTGFSSVWRRRRLRIALLVVFVLTPLLAGGWLFLRQSSLTAVRQVHVSGAQGPEAHAIDAALTDAARHMSTLDVHTGALLASVAPFRVVRDVRVSSSFPHGLHIEVIEQPAVAAITTGGARTAVAADGVVLGPAQLSASLPALSAGGETVSAGAVHGAALLGALSVLGAAPAQLAGEIERTYSGPKGLTVAMKSGLLAYFGDATRPHAKWISLAGVLAAASSAGASYVDVRLPERPAAGFPPGTAPPASASAATEQSSGESGQDLATGLAAAAGGGSASKPAEPAEPAESASTAAPEASSPSTGQAAAEEEGSQAHAETPSAGG